MPWSISQEEDCPEEKPYAVVKDDSGEVEGCHESKEAAQEQIQALYANEGDEAESHKMVAEFEMMAHLEGKPTDDGRTIDPDAIEFRNPPLPLMWTDTRGEGHFGSTLAGVIDHIERKDGQIYARGKFSANESGQRLLEFLREGMPLNPSIDLGAAEMEVEEGKDGNVSMRITKGKLVGVTLVPVPAQEGTWIRERSDENDKELVASVHELPDPIPSAWFENPALSRPTPLTVTDEGRVYGHAFLWNDCHTGFPNTCRKPPKSVTNYAYFQTGAVKTDKGPVPVGHITLKGGHADLHMSAAAARAHYDDTDSAVADVAFGEDKYGGWFSGCVRPGVSREQLHCLQASPVSGDWRPVKEGLELIGLLSVNTPGFPVKRALVASGEVQAMVVSSPALQRVGCDGCDQREDIEMEMKQLRQAYLELAVEQLDRKVGCCGK